MRQKHKFSHLFRWEKSLFWFMYKEKLKFFIILFICLILIMYPELLKITNSKITCLVGFKHSLDIKYCISNTFLFLTFFLIFLQFTIHIGKITGIFSLFCFSDNTLETVIGVVIIHNLPCTVTVI